MFLKDDFDFSSLLLKNQRILELIIRICLISQDFIVYVYLEMILITKINYANKMSFSIFTWPEAEKHEFEFM